VGRLERIAGDRRSIDQQVLGALADTDLSTDALDRGCMGTYPTDGIAFRAPAHNPIARRGSTPRSAERWDITR